MNVSISRVSVHATEAKNLKTEVPDLSSLIQASDLSESRKDTLSNYLKVVADGLKNVKKMETLERKWGTYCTSDFTQ